MNNRILSSLLFISLVCLAGCKDKVSPNEGQKVIMFDLSADPSDIFSLDILEEPVLMNLAHDSILIGDISQVISYGDKIYVLDSSTNHNSIAVVDKQKNNIRQVKRIGRGPLEYISLESIFVDPEKELFGAYSRQDQKIIYFDLDGNEQTETGLPKRFSHIYRTHWGYVGDMGNFGQDTDRDNLWTMDASFVLQDSFFEIPISWESKSFEYHPFSSYGEKTYYTRLLDNNIYTVDKGRITIPYTLDFGVNSWPNPRATYDETKQIMQEHPGRYISEIDRMQETEQHIIVQFLHEGQYRLGIYNKESEKSVVCSTGAYTGKYFIPFGQIVGIDSDAIYTVIQAYQIKRLWNGKDEYNDFEANFPDQIRRLREDFPTIDENGNPFLVIYRFKR